MSLSAWCPKNGLMWLRSSASYPARGPAADLHAGCEPVLGPPVEADAAAVVRGVHPHTTAQVGLVLASQVSAASSVSNTWAGCSARSRQASGRPAAEDHGAGGRPRPTVLADPRPTAAASGPSGRPLRTRVAREPHRPAFAGRAVRRKPLRPGDSGPIRVHRRPAATVCRTVAGHSRGKGHSRCGRRPACI